MATSCGFESHRPHQVKNAFRATGPRRRNATRRRPQYLRRQLTPAVAGREIGGRLRKPYRNPMWAIVVGPVVMLCPVLGHGTDKESLMRILALTILAVGMASAAPSARAQTYDPNYPVCLQIYQSWKDYYFECAYTSLAQCNMSASGRAAQCIVNPYYAGPNPRSRRHRRVY